LDMGTDRVPGRAVLRKVEHLGPGNRPTPGR
jgi:hypothetical protein